MDQREKEFGFLNASREVLKSSSAAGDKGGESWVSPEDKSHRNFNNCPILSCSWNWLRLELLFEPVCRGQAGI